MPKTRLIFDISNFSFSPAMTGIPRYIVEILRRLALRDDLEITTVCSLREEESALRHFKEVFPLELPFQSKTAEHYELPERPTAPDLSLLRRIENRLNALFPENDLLRRLARAARRVKWAFFPPPDPDARPVSPLLEELIRTSDVYFSPYFTPPPELAANPSIRTVLFVHDVIPVLFEGLYKKHHFVCGNPWEKITPDMIVLANSETTKNDLLRLFPNVSAEQVFVTLLAADDRFRPCSDRPAIERVLTRYAVPVSSPYILSVSALDIRKNFEHVLRSFAEFMNRYGKDFPGTRLVLTGVEGYGHRRLMGVFNDLPKHVRDAIIFTGYVADEDLPSLYAGATCFCYMSIYEGFGLPPLEAMQSGTPVVVSDTSSLPEVVGDAGILLDPKDETGLVEAFARMLGDETLRRQLIEKGLRRSERFSWDRCAEQTLHMIAPELFAGKEPS